MSTEAFVFDVQIDFIDYQVGKRMSAFARLGAVSCCLFFGGSSNCGH